MRKKYFFHIAALLIVGMMVSCAKDEDGQQPTEMTVGEAYITDTVRYESDHMTAYNFVYPSKDPYGEAVMLSGTITIGDNVKAARYAKAMLLYNHFTVYRADQCPSKGGLLEQRFTAALDLITISPDYYGFGVTEGKHQAYCISQNNAQGSVDALLGAQKILREKGYTWGDLLFNAGYSQGGQTTMGVVRLVAERYPDIHITYSFAGAGSYDIPATYVQFVDTTIAGMPSTVVSVLLAYNEFKQLGIAREEIFTEPLLSHIDDWIYSKRYTREEIDAKIGSLYFAQYTTPTMADTGSTLSKRFMAAFDGDNLCKGWTPRGDEHLMLFHSTKDITVPSVNTENMYNFLIENGVPADNIDLRIMDIGASGTTPAHEKAAETFVVQALLKLSAIMNEAD